MLSVANVYFRDTQHFCRILMQFWFYATPIVYPCPLRPGAAPTVLGVLDLPLRHALSSSTRWSTSSQAFRALLYDNRWPELGDVLLLQPAAAVVALVVGWTVFRRYEPRLAEEL